MRTVAAFLCAAGASLFLVPPVSAQVVQVRNTGCPNAAYPSHNNTARIGQPLKFSWSCTAPSFAFAMMGYQSGRGFDLGPPLTCVTGPCRWYPAPFPFGYVVWPITGNTGNWTLPIPNDRRLLFSTYSLQCGCLDARRGCFTFSGALSFAIGP